LSSIDAILYAHLAPILFTNLPSTELQSILQKQRNLVIYCNNIMHRFFIEEPPVLFHHGPSKANATSNDSNATTNNTSSSKEKTPQQIARKWRNWIFVASGMASMVLYTGYEYYGFLQHIR